MQTTVHRFSRVRNVAKGWAASLSLSRRMMSSCNDVLVKKLLVSWFLYACDGMPHLGDEVR